MNNRYKNAPLDYRKGNRDWDAKDLVIWSVVLIFAVLALLVLWTPLMLVPLSEMLDAFHGLHRG